MIRSSLRNVALTVLCALFAVAGSAAGSDGFRIEDYIPQKFTDLEWRLDGGMNLNGLTRDHKELPSSTLNPREEGRETKQQYNRLDLSSTILYRYETIPKTFTLGSGLGISLYRNKQETLFDQIDSQGLPRNAKSESTEHSYSISWSPLIDYNRYLIGDIFSGVTGNASFGYSKKPKDDYEYSEYQERRFGDYRWYARSQHNWDGSETKKNIAITITTGTGLGRIYEGQFAATALYMVDELRSAGLLDHEPSKEDMLELTEIVYQNRMAHEVDHRLAKIDALEAVMAFLTDIGSISESQRMSYVLIQDVWDFFPHTRRRFGTQVKTGVGWDYYYSRMDHSRDAHRSYLSYQHHVDSVNYVDTLTNTSDPYDYHIASRSELDNLFLYLAANHCKPLSVRWQWDSNVELVYFVHAEGVRDRNPSRTLLGRNSRAPHLMLIGEIDDYYQFSYGSEGTCIMNSRTSLRLQGDFTYGRYETPIEAGSDRTRTIKSWEGNLGGSLTYRLSIPTALKVSASYSVRGDQNVYEYGQDYDYKNDLSQWSFSASISHYLY